MVQLGVPEKKKNTLNVAIITSCTALGQVEGRLAMLTARKATSMTEYNTKTMSKAQDFSLIQVLL
jgi:hypothetical protein